MKLLEFLIANRIAKGIDEELSIENVLARGPNSPFSVWGRDLDPEHRPRSIDEFALKDGQSSARSIVSVAVAAPNARLAARNFDSGSGDCEWVEDSTIPWHSSDNADSRPHRRAMAVLFRPPKTERNDTILCLRCLSMGRVQLL